MTIKREEDQTNIISSEKCKTNCHFKNCFLKCYQKSFVVLIFEMSSINSNAYKKIQKLLAVLIFVLIALKFLFLDCQIYPKLYFW